MQTEPTPQPLEDIQHIRQLVERNAEYRSLSGWGLIGAGLIGLLGCWYLYWQVVEALAHPEQWPSQRLDWRIVVAATTIPVFMTLVVVWANLERARAFGRQSLDGFSPGSRAFLQFILPFMFSFMLIGSLASNGQYAWVIPAFLTTLTIALANLAFFLPKIDRLILSNLFAVLGFLNVAACTVVPHVLPQIKLLVVGLGIAPIIAGASLLWRHHKDGTVIQSAHSPVSPS